MISPEFSVSEQFIINPVLSLRAPAMPRTDGKEIGFSAEVWQAVQSQVLARIVAVFAPAFAIPDMFAHLASGLYKGSYLLLQNVCHLTPATWSSRDVLIHFKQTAKFSTLLVVGSVAGAIWPDILKFFSYHPEPPPPPANQPGPLPNASLVNSCAPDALQKLANSVANGEIKQPFKPLQTFWKRSTLSDKYWFVTVFNDSSKYFSEVRKTFETCVYKPIPLVSKDRPKWFSNVELNTQLTSMSESIRNAFYFHATSEGALESILKSGRVEVRHEKAFCGAFVSTQPELGFGKYVLAFDKNIERLSRLEHGFQFSHEYWAGFSHDIPVTDTTLACIIVNDTEEVCSSLREKVKLWTGRKIDVVPFHDAQTNLRTIQNLNQGIPEEWKDDDEQVAQTIYNTLKFRAQPVAVAVKVSLTERVRHLWRSVCYQTVRIAHRETSHIQRPVKVHYQRESVAYGQPACQCAMYG